MNTTTNTRGVSEAMVEDAMRVFRQAYAVARMGSPRRVGATYAAVRAVLEHQQGHGAEQAAVDREVGRRWRENSSLEAWFPVTATTMKRQAEEIAATTKLLAPLFKNVDPMPGDCMIGINRTVTLYGYAADVVKQLKAVTAPPAQPATQGEEGFDARKYVRHMADVLEAGGDLFKVDADLLRLAAAINKAANTAPPAQPERVPDGWVLVPREPTAAMADAFGSMATRGFHDCYADMLAATTAAPAEGDGKPSDCSGDPSSCPDNEGHGCHCATTGAAR